MFKEEEDKADSEYARIEMEEVMEVAKETMNTTSDFGVGKENSDFGVGNENSGYAKVHFQVDKKNEKWLPWTTKNNKKQKMSPWTPKKKQIK